ncbi:MAG: hypothetical protein ACRDL7_03455, partial [Gaiellaceae bacterium]
RVSKRTYGFKRDIGSFDVKEPRPVYYLLPFSSVCKGRKLEMRILVCFFSKREDKVRFGGEADRS